jgi:hypothetical protein
MILLIMTRPDPASSSLRCQLSQAVLGTCPTATAKFSLTERITERSDIASSLALSLLADAPAFVVSACDAYRAGLIVSQIDRA